MKQVETTTVYREPILLSPAGKDYLWGGHRLKDDFAKNLDLIPLAETWECSTHPAGHSFVMTGAYKGEKLQDVLKSHPDFIGTHPVKHYEDRAKQGGIPILVKLIDANDNLSVQVHPDDMFAAEHENGQLGKTEMWYVVDAAPGAQLIYGFNRDIDEELVRFALQDGTIENYLQKVRVKTGDVFLIPPGTVHAICAGCVIAEVQESSDLTYRMYDYHRVDSNGQERELHIDKALQVANLKAAITPRQPMHLLRFRPGMASELICRCKYFEVEHIRLNSERVRDTGLLRADKSSFKVLVCTDGCGILFWERDDEDRERSIRFYKGDTIFIPADSVSMHLHGKAELLQVTC